MSDFERDESGFYKPRDPFIGTTKITKEDIVQDFRSPAYALPTTPTQPADEEMIEAGYRALVACKPMTSTDCEREACEAIYTAMRALAKPDDGVVSMDGFECEYDDSEGAESFTIRWPSGRTLVAMASGPIYHAPDKDTRLASLATGDDGIAQETGK